MPDQPKESAQAPAAGEESDWGRNQIDAAIAALDQATRNFTRQMNGPCEPRPGSQPRRREPLAGEPTTVRADQRLPSRTPEPAARPNPDSAFEERMQRAEREAREYLDRAKHRADSLVNTMIGAVEREAAEIRHEAESGIRERWRVIEIEAGRFLEDAKRVSDGMVVERQQRISALSDDLVDRARVLTTGMEDAERIRRQFDMFIRTLSEAAAQIAEQPAGTEDAELTQPPGRRGAGRRRAVAA
jgi:hypothetical protein